MVIANHQGYGQRDTGRRQQGFADGFRRTLGQIRGHNPRHGGLKKAVAGQCNEEIIVITCAAGFGGNGKITKAHGYGFRRFLRKAVLRTGGLREWIGGGQLHGIK